MNPMDIMNQIGLPNPTALNAITTAFGYGINNPNPNEAKAAQMNPANLNEALSQAAYGKSLDEMSTQLGGVMPSFTPGYKPGDADPSHGGTYSSYGSSTGPNGHPSFGTVNDAINNAVAMGISNTSYTHSTALATINDPKSTPRAKELAQKHINALNQVYGKEQDDKDKEASTRGNTGPMGKGINVNDPMSITDPRSGYGIGENTGTPGSQGFGSETDDTSKGGTSTGTTQGTTATTGGPTNDGGLGGGSGVGTGQGVSAGDPNTSTVGNDPSGAGDDGVGTDSASDMGDTTYKGSLITKRKASGKLKPQYKKRGGLASRK